MKRRYFAVIFGVVLFVLLSPEARATEYVYGLSGLTMGDVVVTGYHRTETDYLTDTYYEPRVCGSLYRDGVEMARSCYQGIGSATVTTQTPYVEGSEYEAVTDHLAEMEYYDEYTNSYINELGYFSGGAIPLSDFYFYPTGTYSTSPVNAINLGSTSVRITGPHHLWVVSDTTTTLSCGGPERKWLFKVVDSNNHNVGRIHIKEQFPGTIVDSCHGVIVTPGACSNQYYDTTFKSITDTVRSDCAPHTPVCGFEIRHNEWRWCKPGIAERTLATMLYQVYTNGIKLDGSNQFSPGHRIF